MMLACFPERIAPAIVAAQKQFKFSHIIAGADATGKVILVLAQEFFSSKVFGVAVFSCLLTRLGQFDLADCV